MTNSSSRLPQTESTVIEFVNEAANVCRHAARGDLEQRIVHLPRDPELRELAVSINSLLDTTDCFVRESAATLKASSQKKFYRRFMVRGLPGTFRRGAMMINASSQEMAHQDEALVQAIEYRKEVYARLEDLVDQSNEHVATSVYEISKILGGVTVLAINARIEASRAGEASAGFAVVAAEIERMAKQITRATDKLTGEVKSFMEASREILDTIVERSETEKAA